MDKYGLSNETRAAKDDSSALYHMLLCGSGVAVGGEGGRGGGVEGVVVHEEALKPSVWALSVVADFQSQWLCSVRENNLRYQRDSNEKFHFQSSGSICAALWCTLKWKAIASILHIQSSGTNLLSAVHNGSKYSSKNIIHVLNDIVFYSVRLLTQSSINPLLGINPWSGWS